MQKERYFGMSSRIARWKIDNPFENWLTYKADSSLFWKRLPQVAEHKVVVLNITYNQAEYVEDNLNIIFNMCL